jgi:hypothetical protein
MSYEISMQVINLGSIAELSGIYFNTGCTFSSHPTERGWWRSQLQGVDATGVEYLGIHNGQIHNS